MSKINKKDTNSGELDANFKQIPHLFKSFYCWGWTGNFFPGHKYWIKSKLKIFKKA